MNYCPRKFNVVDKLVANKKEIVGIRVIENI